ncbi:MAG: XdhC family protein [Pyrinomonadaceae bacterium]
MPNELELWQFVVERLKRDEPIALLVVAESSGSSPGRAGYKMAVSADGELFGSIGGGVMEVNLVEQSRALLSEPRAVATGFLRPQLIEQVHQKNSPHASGMICSGRQTVLLTTLTENDTHTIDAIINAFDSGRDAYMKISPNGITIEKEGGACFSKKTDREFSYTERLGHKHELYIIGGGHCSLALSELMSKLGFHITIFDDRPDLNTIEKNRFADEIRIIESYENIGAMIPAGSDSYVVVMTLGYASDEIAIRSLIHRDLKYFGVLGSNAKMSVLLRALEKEGFSADRIAKIRTPIGLPINSHTPEEIAVSIAAEIISVKNARRF